MSTAGMRDTIDLDELQAEAEKLVALLEDRHPGLMTWNMFLQQRLQNLRRLTDSPK